MSDTSGYIPYTAEEGNGFTDEDLLLCHNAAQAVRPKLLQAIAEIPCDGESLFTICDYATGDATASLSNVKELVGYLRGKYGPSLPIQVIYEDQPSNDYKSLVQRIHGNNKNSTQALVGSDPNLYVLISSTGFHDNCLPPQSVHLGFSVAAMHYLDRLPCKITGAIHSKGITVKEELAAFHQEAKKDWENLLLARSKEIKSGGRFVIHALMTDKKGCYSGSYNAAVNFFLNYGRLWKQYVDEGIITQEEFDNTNSLHYLRSIDEYSQPFQDVTSSVYRAGLRLVSIDTFYNHCPHQARWMKTADKDDPTNKRDHARRFVSSVRYWTNWIFLNGLSTERPLEEREHITKMLFQRFEDDVSASPGDYVFTDVVALIHFKKL